MLSHFPVEQVIKPIVADTLWGAEARRCILSPRLFCIRLGEHFICVPPPPLPTPKAEQSSISTVSFILLRALLYTTPTPITFHNPITLNPHLYLFIDHSTRLFCHANPCIGICLIALSTVGVLVGLVATSPMSFGMSSMHVRVVLSIPARLYFPHAMSSCGFVGVARAVTFCNYCCNHIGLSLRVKFCQYGFFDYPILIRY